jgi:hypothetical protein
LHEFHDKEDVAQVVQVLWSDDVVDLGGEAVVLHLAELPKNLDFSDYFLGIIVASKNIFDEFYGNLCTSLSVFGLDDFTVAPDADELDELVVLKCVPPYRGECDHTLLLALWAANAGGLVAHCLVFLRDSFI